MFARLLRRLVVTVFVLSAVYLNVNVVTAQQAVTGKIIAQSGDAYVAYDDRTQTFEIGSVGISRRMDYDAGGGYRLISLKNKLTGREWLAPNSGTSAELRLGLDGQIVTGSARDFVLRGYTTQKHADGSLELEVVLMRGALLAHLHYVVYPGLSVFEQWAQVENSGSSPMRDLTALDSVSVALRPSNEPLTLYWVQGLNPPDSDKSQERQVPTLKLRSTVLESGVAETIGSSGRSSEDSMGWFALASPALQEGLFGGIEWSGAWQLRAARDQAQTSLQAGLQGIRQDLAPGETFASPRRFMGFYTGDLDQAAHVTHQFARDYLMPPRPANFPWTQYNTWFAYYTNLDEEQLMREVDSAAQLGLEAFVVDAGWYDGSVTHGDFSWGLGSWREDPDKFPRGLATLSDYAHSRGLKFGLWVEPERVDLRFVGPDKEISRDWLQPGVAFDVPPPPDQPQVALICLGNRQAREWMKDWLARLVRDYDLDWLKWDFNYGMACDPPGEPGRGNYEHVLGLYEVLDYLRQEFPNLIIENCASGGNRMDYGLLRRTHVAWLSDETDPSYRVRYHLFGASYPFPPEYLNSWLVESWWEHLADTRDNSALLRAWLQSRMMGAFGLSVSTLDWTPQMRAVVATEIAQYKRYRPIIAQGHHHHLLPQANLMAPQIAPPSEPDAIEFFDPQTTEEVIFLFKGAVPWSERRVRLRHALPDVTYQVKTPDGVILMERSGAELINAEITFAYPEGQPSTLLLVTPLDKSSPHEKMGGP
ncbi:MAG: alpha-galactosidase [Chloroflexi bacterium]|nr:alpha-galactosidase [Chloroflexota bacterium]